MRGIRRRLERMERANPKVQEDPWKKLTPDQMEEFARTGDLPSGVTVGELFPPGQKSPFDNWTPSMRDEFLRTGELPAGVDPDSLCAGWK
jgi:hypothetical protein